MPSMAKIFAMLNIDTALKRNRELDHYKILKLDIKACEPDERRKPWLWDAVATMAITNKPDREGDVGTTLSMVWTFRFHLPQDGRGGECWREATETRFGSQFRQRYETSEWARDFRDKVAAG
jgi:hypothetical protein